jgi:DNA-binding transcriptional ArsR family regulator
MARSGQLSGDELVLALSALANPHRLRIIAALARGSTYSSQLARDLGLSRPLLHMHVQRLEAAGLVVGRLEVSEDGKAMRYYDLADFEISLDADRIADAAASLTDDGSSTVTRRGKRDGRS